MADTTPIVERLDNGDLLCERLSAEKPLPPRQSWPRYVFQTREDESIHSLCMIFVHHDGSVAFAGEWAQVGIGARDLECLAALLREAARG